MSAYSARALIASLLVMSLAACGFQLRGQSRAQLPPALSSLRVTLNGSSGTSDPLLVDVRNALITQAAANIVDDPKAATLTLMGEHVDPQVVSVRTTTGKANEYRLRYTVNFQLADASGKLLLEPQAIRLQREYTFDPNRVLAKEQEERELVREMRRDAAQQIVRRLSRLGKSQTPDADKS